MKIDLQPAEKTLVLFDFDGTLTRGDTLSRFLIFAAGWGGAVAGLLRSLPALLWLFVSPGWENGRAKAIILASFFRGKKRQTLEELGKKFCENVLPGFLRREMMDKLEAFSGQGSEVALVSASLDFWLKPFAEKHRLVLLCTEAEYDANDCFTGNFATENCQYEEKARRISAHFDLSGFDKIIAFGNSKGDDAMFSLATDFQKI